MKPAAFYIASFMVWMVVTVVGIWAISFGYHLLVMGDAEFEIPLPEAVSVWVSGLIVAPLMTARTFRTREERRMDRGESWFYTFAFTAGALFVAAAGIALDAALNPDVAGELAWAWNNARPIPEIAIAVLTALILGLMKLLLVLGRRNQSRRAARKG